MSLKNYLFLFQINTQGLTYFKINAFSWMVIFVDSLPINMSVSMYIILYNIRKYVLFALKV